MCSTHLGAVDCFSTPLPVTTCSYWKSPVDHNEWSYSTNFLLEQNSEVVMSVTWLHTHVSELDGSVDNPESALSHGYRHLPKIWSKMKATLQKNNKLWIHVASMTMLPTLSNRLLFEQSIANFTQVTLLDKGLIRTLSSFQELRVICLYSI